MRIISEWSDFYDGAQAFGHDTTIIYQRKRVEYESDNFPGVIEELHKKVRSLKGEETRYWYERGVLPNTIFSKDESYLTGSGNIVFCGKLYPYLTLSKDIKGSITRGPIHYFYTSDSILEFCDSNGLKIDCSSYRWEKTTIRKKIVSKLSKEFALDIDWLIVNKVICAEVNPKTVTINPSLKERQFYKVMDAYSTFQCLDSWICGTLSYPQNSMVQLDDKSLITKHGFDEWSFRKQPKGYGL